MPERFNKNKAKPALVETAMPLAGCGGRFSQTLWRENHLRKGFSCEFFQMVAIIISLSCAHACIVNPKTIECTQIIANSFPVLIKLVARGTTWVAYRPVGFVASLNITALVASLHTAQQIWLSYAIAGNCSRKHGLSIRVTINVYVLVRVHGALYTC